MLLRLVLLVLFCCHNIKAKAAGNKCSKFAKALIFQINIVLLLKLSTYRATAGGLKKLKKCYFREVASFKISGQSLVMRGRTESIYGEKLIGAGGQWNLKFCLFCIRNQVCSSRRYEV